MQNFESIICPCCGAENSGWGQCEYCGSVLQHSKKKSSSTIRCGLVDGNKLYDTQGNLIVKSDTIKDIGRNEFLLTTFGIEGKQEIFINTPQKEILPVSLPKGIKILESLGFNCYKVQEERDKRIYVGIAMRDKLLLPCYYSIYSDKNVSRGNSNVVFIEDRRIREGLYTYGIFDLMKREVILPCKYNIKFDSYRNNQIVIVNEKKKYGVFDFAQQKIIIPTVCSYIELGKFHNNSNLIVISDGSCGYGIFDLKKRKVILPCKYRLEVDEFINDKIFIYEINKEKYGVFDLVLQKIVVPIVYDKIYDKISQQNDRVFVALKKGIFGDKKIEIQL